MFKRVIKVARDIDPRLYVCFLLVLGSAALGLFVYQYPVIRLGEAGRDLFGSLALLFYDFCGKELPAVTVNDFTGVDISAAVGINGIDTAAIGERLQRVWAAFAVPQNVIVYLIYVVFWLINIARLLVIALLVLLFLAVPIVFSWDSSDIEHNVDTLPFAVCKRVLINPVCLVAACCRDFFAFFRSSILWRWFLAVWAINIGFVAILGSFFAYYLYLVVTLDFSTVGVQILKLLADVLLAVHTLPVVMWAALIVLFLYRVFVKRALMRLRRMVYGLYETLGRLPMVIFLVGLPRAGKTTMLTMLGLLFSVIFRRKAHELMIGNVHKFPNFPWINVEKELRDRVEEHTVYNLYTTREWVAQKQRAFEDDPSRDKIFGYDYENNSFTFNDHLSVISVWQAVENYAQEFYIYWLQSSMLAANYAVREDFDFVDIGNHPLLDDDFFARDSLEGDSRSKMCHILDYDMLRKGVQMIEDNAHTGLLEFGVVMVSEGSQERGNADTLRAQGIKGSDATCNQLNDLFEEDLQTRGHAATVENYNFFRFLIDSHRSSGWAAKGRELGNVLNVNPKNGSHVALPFFWMINGVMTRYLDWWNEEYWQCRYRWGSNRLTMWVLESIASLFYRIKLLVLNDYGYFRQTVEMESGKMDGDKEELVLGVPHKMIYNRRFATDCFKEYTAALTAECKLGLNDLSTYQTLYPTFEELDKQNSHYFNKMFGHYVLRES